MKKLTLILTLILGLLFLNSCKTNSEDEKGSLTIKFSHLIDNNEIIFDSIIYVNEAGNRYEVNEIQYFISDLSLISNSGEKHNLINDQSIHYIDSDIPETMQWLASNDLPVTKYDSLVFTFGLSEANNTSFRFVNPPERDMVWPELLGGGRGNYQSYCILLSDYSKLSSEGRTRIQTMVNSNDGFEIADVDLRLRGPGDLEGTAQSGILELKIANLVRDERMLVVAKNEADRVLQYENGLNNPENINILNHFLLLRKKRKSYSQIS
jgi:hypothetical protein